VDRIGRGLVRILVQIHTWNDVDVIGALLGAIQRQSFAVIEILIVDNGSTDGTAELAYPDNVTLIRHRSNLGTSGSVKTGLEYARAHGYEWLWVLDADSLPRPDTLELLTRLIGGSDGDREVGVVCASHDLSNLGQLLRGRLLTPGGPRLPKVMPDREGIDCDCVIWSGALINLAVVERVGLPRAGTIGCWEDLSLDYGDTEYTYRIHRAGYKILVHRDSVIEHPVGMGLHCRILGWDLYTTNHPAFRRYLYFRNLVFFWLRIYPRRNWPMLLVWFGYRLGMVLAGIMLLEERRVPKLKACFLGIRDGLRGRLDRSFEAPR
jgi:GT2 family glycosyltransferase